MKTAVLLPAIPDMEWVKTHGEMCIDVIRKYFNKFDHQVIVMDKNPGINVSHNSWLWLQAHKLYPGLDFILCWNLDILPNRFDVDIFDCLDLDAINAPREADGSSVAFPYYRWNCGQVGFPKRYSEFMEKIFEKYSGNPKCWPSYEQYYVNEEIGENNVFVHEIPRTFNIGCGHETKDTCCVHFTYTVFKDKEPRATTAIEKHIAKLKEEGLI